ncbi:MAG: hypothetical protein JO213_10855 [Alphaproteobacteria bacterium]|nr:hypothetical protein [Alphaproteobacteria bacterium]MBV9585373.1 hypothetical protein [Alphaproteobacteria bacterium]
MPRDDFDVITGPTAPIRPIPPAIAPPAPSGAPPETQPERARDGTRGTREHRED